MLAHGGTIALQVRGGGEVTVDPQARVGWRDAVGRGSGEAVQLEVSGRGTVWVPGLRAEARGRGALAMTVLDPSTLPVDDNISPHAFCPELDGEWFLHKGATLACYGQRRFRALSVTTGST